MIAIIKNTFSPLNLPSLDRNSTVEHDTEYAISLVGGQLKQKKVVGKLASFGTTPDTWSTTFLIFAAIVSSFFGPQFPTLTAKLLFFHNKILKLAKTYKWQGAVLNLAIEFHERRVSTGLTDASAWVLDANLIDDFTRGHQLGARDPASSSSSKPKGSSNKSGVVCQNYNKDKGCHFDGCERDHVCENCGEGHPRSECSLNVE